MEKQIFGKINLGLHQENDFSSWRQVFEQGPLERTLVNLYVHFLILRSYYLS